MTSLDSADTRTYMVLHDAYFHGKTLDAFLKSDTCSHRKAIEVNVETDKTDLCLRDSFCTGCNASFHDLFYKRRIRNEVQQIRLTDENALLFNNLKLLCTAASEMMIWSPLVHENGTFVKFQELMTWIAKSNIKNLIVGENCVATSKTTWSEMLALKGLGNLEHLIFHLHCRSDLQNFSIFLKNNEKTDIEAHFQGCEVSGNESCKEELEKIVHDMALNASYSNRKVCHRIYFERSTENEMEKKMNIDVESMMEEMNLK